MNLEAENARLRAENEVLRGVIARLEERINDLEGQLKQNSRNSSRPPSSDGLKRPVKPKSLRQKSGKQAGGQAGHEGKSLAMVAEADKVVAYAPEQCPCCGQGLVGVEPLPAVVGRRQVFDLPSLKLEVTEHRTRAICCPACQAVAVGHFPAEVGQPAQYGAGVRALATYLVGQQLLPYERAAQVIEDLFGQAISPGTLVTMMAEGAERVAMAAMPSIQTALRQARVLHCDETGLYVNGRRVWLHVASTPQQTFFFPHPKRGRQATDALAILPDFQGTAVHDALANYASYPCAHALCNVHLLRELTFIHEEVGQSWANDLKQLLCGVNREVDQARQAGHTRLAAPRLQWLQQQYQSCLDAAFEANPPPPAGWPRGKRGRPKRPKARNLADRLDRCRREVLAFAHDFAIPFDNNLAERDLRMVKVQQKISGCFRSWQGAEVFCHLRSYLSTMRKQGYRIWCVLLCLFSPNPLLPDPA